MTGIDRILPSAVAEIGGIRIGTLKPDQRFPAVKLDHFLLTTPYRDARGVFVPDEALMGALRDAGCADPDQKIRSLPVLFPSNSLDDCLQIRYEWWPGKSRLGAVSNNLVKGDFQLAKSDVSVTFYANPQTGEPLAQPETREWDERLLDLTDPEDAKKDPDKRRSLLKLSTTLGVMIASPAARFGGLYRFRSKGFHTATQLLGSLQHIKYQLTFGLLRGPRFRLCVRPKVCRPKGMVSTVYVVHVECENSDLMALRAAARENALYERDNLALVGEIASHARALTAGVGTEDDADEEREEQVKALPAAGQPAREPQPSDLEQKAAAALDKARGNPERLKGVWGQILRDRDAGKFDDAAFARLEKRKDGHKAALPKTQPAATAPEDNPADDVPPDREEYEAAVPDEPEPAAKQAEQQQPAPKPAPEPGPAPETQAKPAGDQPQPTAPAQQKAGPQILKDVGELHTAAGLTWEEVYSKWGAQLGLTSFRAQDMTAPQATALRALLRQLRAKQAEPVATG